MVLSSEQRLLVFLLETEAAGSSSTRSAPTQSALAGALGISRSQVSRLGAALAEKGWVQEERARLAGFSRSVTAYSLTAAGRREAARIRELVRLTTPDSGASGPATGGQPTAATGLVRAEPPVRVRTGEGFRRDLIEAPPERPFLGRGAERLAAQRWLESRDPIYALEGPAGHGKSSFAAHIVRSATIPRHILWIRVSEATYGKGVVDRLDGFLRALGRPGLASEQQDSEQLRRHFVERIGRLPLLIVVDDVQKASPELQPVLWTISRLAGACAGLKLWLLGREVVVPHDVLPETRRDSLGPLPPSDADLLLREMGVAEPDRGPLLRRCGGSPLFLALAARGPSRQQTDLAHYLLRELIPGLPAEAQEVLRLVCAMRVPATPELMARLGGNDADVLQGLMQVNVLVRDQSGLLSMHDLVRETLYGALSAETRRRLHGALAEALRPRGDWSEVPEFLHHLARAGRRDEAVRWLMRHRSQFLEATENLFRRSKAPVSEPVLASGPGSAGARPE